MVIKEEQLQKVINKSFDALEDKVDNISKLSGKDIFDITTTGMSYYDAMLHKEYIAGNRDPVEYFKTNKGLVFEIEWMSPEDYLEKSFEINNEAIKAFGGVQKSFKEQLRINIDPELIKEYKERTLSGSKMPIIMLDYNNMSQEGRHRAVVAQQLNVEEIPVLVVRTYEE